MTEPKWLTEARRHVGLREVPGKGDNPVIANWLRTLKAAWTDDATPWCGTFAAHCVRTAGLPLPKHWYRALAWAEWGEATLQPTLGCVVVFKRDGGGHVAFAVGRDKLGRLLCLGGNQGDAVSIAAFDPARVVAYREPAGYHGAALPVLDYGGAASRNEA